MDQFISKQIIEEIIGKEKLAVIINKHIASPEFIKILKNYINGLIPEILEDIIEKKRNEINTIMEKNIMILFNDIKKDNDVRDLITKELKFEIKHGIENNFHDNYDKIITKVENALSNEMEKIINDKFPISKNK